MKINYLDNKNLPQLAAFFILTAIFALSWDVWWHVAVGRDTFWEPPHFFLYAAIGLGIALGILGYLRSHKVWKYFAIFLGLIILSAPFDDMWHRMYGVERLDSIWIIWSPPHLVLIAGLIGSLWSLLKLLGKDNRILSTLILASILAVLFAFLIPINPFGAFRLLGFWGAGILGAVFTSTFIFAGRTSSIISATFVALVFIVFYFIQEPIQITPGVIIPPHPHPPGWIIAFSLLLPALAIDLLQNKTNPVAIGLIAAFLYAGILYGLSSDFIDPQFRYPFLEAVTAIISSLTGGLVVGIFYRWKYS